MRLKVTQAPFPLQDDPDRGRQKLICFAENNFNKSIITKFILGNIQQAIDDNIFQ
ncbi:hypothetical protein VC863_15760 [Citrobacter freundii]|nr:hypothetical protein [Citrobacter freundii]